MYKSNLQIIEQLQQFLYSANISGEIYKERIEDFSRNRHLNLQRVVLAIINLLRKSLGVELDELFHNLGNPSEGCSQSAFSQARRKLKSEFFISWNKELIDQYYTNNENRVECWKEFLLFGIDGSTSYLFERKSVTTHFGKHRGKTMGRLMVCYDLLNKLGIYSKIGSIKVGERNMVKDWVEQMSQDFDQRVMVLYDSGFPCFSLMYLHQHHQVDFVMRCSVDFNNEVKSFVQGGRTHLTKRLRITEKGYRELRRRGFEVHANTEIKVRMVRVILDNGQVEVLLTSLLNCKKYPSKLFKALYHLRWGSETFYGHLKNNLQIEVISGRSVKAIEQDFYASIFTANIQSLIINECKEQIQQINKNRKYKYKINRNVSLGLLKNRIIKIFVMNNPQIILEELKGKFIKQLTPIRPNRTFERKPFSRRRRGKYQTFTNYKRAI